MKLIPVLDRLIVKRDGEYENAKVGIIDSVPSPNKFPPRIVPGSTVLYNDNGTVEFEEDDVEYEIIGLNNILAVKP